MNDLRKTNEKMFEEYMDFDNKEELSCPNLVSSKKFLDSIKKKPILYIGKETNEWINNYDSFDYNNVSLDDIEDSYDNFYTDGTTSKTTFWRFIKECLKTDYNAINKDTVWCNTLLCGKRYGRGTPKTDKKLFDASLEYLLFLYEYFEPSCVIDVSGNDNPYYDITKEFLNKIGSNLAQTWPGNNNSILIDKNKNIIWTYHPYKLNFMGKVKVYSNQINNNIKGI